MRYYLEKKLVFLGIKPATKFAEPYQERCELCTKHHGRSHFEKLS
jgi:hypothetical protein